MIFHGLSVICCFTCKTVHGVLPLNGILISLIVLGKRDIVIGALMTQHEHFFSVLELFHDLISCSQFILKQEKFLNYCLG